MRSTPGEIQIADSPVGVGEPMMFLPPLKMPRWSRIATLAIVATTGTLFALGVRAAIPILLFLVGLTIVGVGGQITAALQLERESR